MTEPRTVRVAFVGITHPHSSGRYRSAADLDGVDLVGAADVDGTALQAFCQEVGASPRTVEDILADPDVDGVLVHSKSDQMAALGVAAIRAGKHVLIEKPGGATVADLRSLAEAAEAREDLVTRVGYNFHFSPAVARTRSQLEEDAVGTVTLVRGHGACSRQEHLAAHLNQPADMAGGLWVIGCHTLHLMVELLGRPDAVRASVEKLPGLSTASSREDVASVTMLYPDKLATFDFTVHEDCEWFESSEVTLYGTAGQLTMGVLPGRVSTLRVDDDRDRAGWSDWHEGRFAAPWGGDDSSFSELPQVGNRFFFDEELKEFVAAIRGEEGAGVPASTALDVALIVAAALQSAERDGVRVALQDLSA
ncbi:MAG: Gfo/Idh/MocA family oxidoreductase [Nocardioides sp.]